MNRLIKISLFVLLLLLVSAPSCEDEQEKANREEAILRDARNEIRNEFETDYLTEASLFGYATNAKQKLTDFYDYLNIVADTSLNKTFRQKASGMINDLFIPKPLTLNLMNNKSKNHVTSSMKQFLSDLQSNKLSFPEFKADSITLKQPFRRTNESSYTGSLTFSQSMRENNKQNKNSRRTNKIVNIHLNKEYKSFGQDTLYVWNVRLGDIK